MMKNKVVSFMTPTLIRGCFITNSFKIACEYVYDIKHEEMIRLIIDKKEYIPSILADFTYRDWNYNVDEIIIGKPFPHRNLLLELKMSRRKKKKRRKLYSYVKPKNK